MFFHICSVQIPLFQGTYLLAFDLFAYTSILFFFQIMVFSLRLKMVRIYIQQIYNMFPMSQQKLPVTQRQPNSVCQKEKVKKASFQDVNNPDSGCLFLFFHKYVSLFFNC